MLPLVEANQNDRISPPSVSRSSRCGTGGRLSSASNNRMRNVNVLYCNVSDMKTAPAKVNNFLPATASGATVKPLIRRFWRLEYCSFSFADTRISQMSRRKSSAALVGSGCGQSSKALIRLSSDTIS